MVALFTYIRALQKKWIYQNSVDKILLNHWSTYLFLFAERNEQMKDEQAGVCRQSSHWLASVLFSLS